MKSVLAWVLLGLVGLVLAGGAAVGVVRLTGQDAGLSGEPLDAGNELIPKVVRTTVTRTTTIQPTVSTESRTSPVTPVTPTAGQPQSTPPVVTSPGQTSDDRDGDDKRGRRPSGGDD